MVLAVVIALQLATTSQNPCADQLEALCKISPYFCAGSYPADLVPGSQDVPCWPERSVSPVTSGPSSLGHNTNSVNRLTTNSHPQASPRPSAQPDSAAPTLRERFTRAIQRLVAPTSSP
jgi:hypothetical protein